jgi:hypothetical protein
MVSWKVTFFGIFSTFLRNQKWKEGNLRSGLTIKKSFKSFNNIKSSPFGPKRRKKNCDKVDHRTLKKKINEIRRIWKEEFCFHLVYCSNVKRLANHQTFYIGSKKKPKVSKYERKSKCKVIWIEVNFSFSHSRNQNFGNEPLIDCSKGEI